MRRKEKKIQVPKSLLKGIFNFLECESYYEQNNDNLSDTSSISDNDNSFEFSDKFYGKNKQFGFGKGIKNVVPDSPAIKMHIYDRKENRFCISMKNLKRKKLL